MEERQPTSDEFLELCERYSKLSLGQLMAGYDRLTSELTFAKEEGAALIESQMQRAEAAESALVAAKEEIERLKGEITYRDKREEGEITRAIAAESLLSAERKETERLRGAVKSQHEETHKYRNALLASGCHDLFCKEFAKDCRECGMNRKAAEYCAALQEQQGEE